MNLIINQPKARSYIYIASLAYLDLQASTFLHFQLPLKAIKAKKNEDSCLDFVFT